MEGLCAVLREAGAILKERFRQAVRYEEKSRRDLVSDADREIEAFVLSHMQKMDPSACFYSEEAKEVGNPGGSRWILDPLDGTANFIFGIPHFSISLAREERGHIVEGYVHNPISDELFHCDTSSPRPW